MRTGLTHSVIGDHHVRTDDRVIITAQRTDHVSPLEAVTHCLVRAPLPQIHFTGSEVAGLVVRGEDRNALRDLDGPRSRIFELLVMRGHVRRAVVGGDGRANHAATIGSVRRQIWQRIEPIDRREANSQHRRRLLRRHHQVIDRGGRHDRTRIRMRG
ncbi:hypothetical protein AOT83_12765 [Mycobacteroides sp. H001]|nr:hypothetical protein AOT86_15485 [Mycobacteroides sp. H072]KRQ34701.1 hypothetical protein AOT84_18105 [Mycobacteroides sp. H002]KRQ56004.1 hypothetical protein AOT85_01165 [Mycobacteroides sp. H054]KRQ70151.1 hypothetical protein AOT83_12765 [Mycobacteroides sp. H001]OHU33179.1 hypothetical protein BKG79_21360 [Mycobacteroides chelonae]